VLGYLSLLKTLRLVEEDFSHYDELFQGLRDRSVWSRQPRQTPD